jgi:hypothetical protein
MSRQRTAASRSWQAECAAPVQRIFPLADADAEEARLADQVHARPRKWRDESGRREKVVKKIRVRLQQRDVHTLDLAKTRPIIMPAGPPLKMQQSVSIRSAVLVCCLADCSSLRLDVRRRRAWAAHCRLPNRYRPRSCPLIGESVTLPTECSVRRCNPARALAPGRDVSRHLCAQAPDRSIELVLEVLGVRLLFISSSRRCGSRRGVPATRRSRVMRSTVCQFQTSSGLPSIQLEPGALHSEERGGSTGSFGALRRKKKTPMLQG